MKNKQFLLIKSVPVLAIASMVAFNPSSLQAAYPVTDAGVIAELEILNSTAARIEGQASAINRSTAQTAQNTTQIMRDTSQINKTTLETLPKIQQDIQTMREIGEARQKLTLEIAKLSQLTTKGNVFKEDPFVDAVASRGIATPLGGGDSITQILTEMGEYIKTPWDLQGDPGLDSVTQDKMATNSFSAGSNLSYRFDEADTLITPQAAGMDEVRGKIEALFGFSWNGLGFVGKNAQYMQAMVGHGGRTLGFDYIPPVAQISLSETQKRRLKRTPTAALSDVLKNHMRENYRRVSQSGENPWEISPGIYVRPKTEADSLFEKMVLSSEATPGTEAAFYAAASSYARSQYDPFWGFSEKADLTLPINVNDVLTRGAFSAIGEYLSKHGGTVEENPYGNFGKAIAPVIANLVDRAVPGSNLLITEADIQRASEANGLSLKGVPSTPEEWTNMFARSEKAQNEYIRVTTSVVPPPAPANEQIMVLFGLNKKDTKTYNAKMLANSARLSQNNKTLLTQVCLLNYNQRALEAVVELETALTGLSASATAKNVVEMLPMMRDSAQNTILVLQNRIGQLQAQVDSLLKDKYEALADRQKTVEEYQQVIISESKGQVERIMMSTAPTSLPM